MLVDYFNGISRKFIAFSALVDSLIVRRGMIFKSNQVLCMMSLVP